jgi:hypothetical protein
MAKTPSNDRPKSEALTNPASDLQPVTAGGDQDACPWLSLCRCNTDSYSSTQGNYSSVGRPEDLEDTTYPNVPAYDPRTMDNDIRYAGAQFSGEETKE